LITNPLLSLSLFSLKTERDGERCSERERARKEKTEKERATEEAVREIAEKNGFFKGINRSFCFVFFFLKKKFLIIVRFSCVDSSSCGFLWVFDYNQ
jgi:hypothetical protein